MNTIKLWGRLKRMVSRGMFFFKYRRTDKKYRLFLKGRIIYFSIYPSEAGFSDQLFRFTAIYKLGKFLDLKYFHIAFLPKPLIIEPDQEVYNSFGNTENHKDSGIYDFIGFNTYFHSMNPGFAADDLDKTTIIVNQSDLKKNRVTNFNQLVHFLELAIIRSLEKSLKTEFLINFKFANEILAFFWIIARIPNKTLDFDFKEIYLKNRETNPHQLKFDNNKIKLLLHSRQGDTAVIKTPWNTFIQVWGRKGNAFKEFDTIHQINDVSIVTVDDYYSFYKNLTRVFGAEKLSTLLFSDGFARSFFKLFAKTGKLNFTESQVEQLQKWMLTYNQESFKEFEEPVELNMFIGEEPEKLFDLVHSFLHSDIVIFGTQQRMIPKLYSLYFPNNEGPFCLVLYRQKLVSYDQLSNPQMSENFVFINLDNYDILEIYGRIMNFLKERKKAQFKYSDISKL